MFNSITKTWDLIREVIKDVPIPDDKIPVYPPGSSHACMREEVNPEEVNREEVNREEVNREEVDPEDDEFEPLGEVEQALLDGWLKVEGPRGCHWIHDSGQYCNEPLSLLHSRYPYCEEHLRRSLTEAGWQRTLVRAGRLRDIVDEPDRGKDDHKQVTNL